MRFVHLLCYLLLNCVFSWIFYRNLHYLILINDDKISRKRMRLQETKLERKTAFSIIPTPHIAWVLKFY